MIAPRLLPFLAAAALAAGCPGRSSAATPDGFKFQFGASQPAAGFTLVPPSAAYSREAGFGFEPGASVTAMPAAGAPADPLQGGAVTAAQPFFFSVKVPEGNYRVTVTLGDPGAAAVTTVKAETRRLMLEQIRTGAGEFVQRTFTVNVRGPKISTGGEVNLDSHEMNLATHEAIARHWDDKLTLEFSGVQPAVAALAIERTDAITVFVTGDSTVTDQPGWPGSSWGQMFPRWFKPEVAVANHAESGETLKGFLKERRWDKVLDSIKPGDYVIIEFGTNDSKSSGPQNIYPNQDFAETYAPAATTYKDLLRRFVGDAKAKGAFPIIASPSARRGETGAHTSLGAWATAAMEVAKETGVPGIDLNAMGVELNRALGADAVKQFNDHTHHVEYGSYLQAKCIVLGIQRAQLPLARYIVDDFQFDPEHPEPLPEQFDLPPDPRLPRAGGRRPGAAAPAAAPKAE
jgi:lysophospholipase L1-like esterase